MKRISLMGNFTHYIRTHYGVVLCAAAVVLIVYWQRLTQWNIGIDTHTFMAGENMIKWNLSLGRFGTAFLLLFFSQNFSLCFANILSVILLFLGDIFWCELFEEIYLQTSTNEEESKKNKKYNLFSIMFSLFFLSSPVWIEVIYFTFLGPCYCLGIMLCPLAVTEFINAVSTKNDMGGNKIWGEVAPFVLPTILSIICLSTYECLFFMLCEGILISFVIIFDREKSINKIEWKVCRKLILSAAAVLSGYYIVGGVIRFIFRVQSSGYISSMIGIDSSNIAKTILKTGYYIFKIFFNNISIVMEPINKIAVKFANHGEESVLKISETASFPACLLVVPAIVYFLYKICKHRNAWKMIFVTGIFIVPLILPILGGGSAPIRTQMALPLVISFLIAFIVQYVEKRGMIIVFICGILFCARQITVDTALFATDQMRYEADYKLACEINNAIMNEKENGDNAVPVSDNLKLLFIGKNSPNLGKRAVKGDVIGHSIFEWVNGESIIEGTDYNVSLLNVFGADYRAVDENDPNLEWLRKCSDNMPIWPANGAVKSVGEEYVIIKLGESVYESEK